MSAIESIFSMPLSSLFFAAAAVAAAAAGGGGAAAGAARVAAGGEFAFACVGCCGVYRCEEVEEEGEGGIDVPECKQSRITSFFQVKQKTGATIQRPKFFVRNRLELITSASRI